jgi:hypothetical protein
MGGVVELFGILILVPLGALAIAAYCAILSKLAHRLEPWRSNMYSAGVVVLTALAAELAVLFCFGAHRLQAMLGPAFYSTHLAIVSLASPSLANVLVLRRRGWRFNNWHWASAPCAILVLGLALLQMSVSEAIFGIQ